MPRITLPKDESPTIKFVRERYIKEAIEQKKEKQGKTYVKKKSKKIGKILKKPTIKLQELSAVKALAKGIPSDAALVSKGRTGFFQEEYEKEEKWLGGYSI